MPWPATIETRLTGLRCLRDGCYVDPLRLRRPIILRPRNILLLHWSNHHLLRPRLLVSQPWALRGTFGRSNCELRLPLLHVMKMEVFLHGDGVIHHLIEILKTAAQTGPKFRIHSFQETFSFLFIRVHVTRGITSQLIKFLDILPNSSASLLQSHELTKLNLNHTRGDMMSLKSCTELRPKDLVSGRLHSKECIPPRGGRASKLMSCKEGLLLFRTC